MASSSIAASATVRAIGPGTARPASLSTPEPAGTSPRDGFSPTRPHAAAGIRIDPPPSDPGANGSSPAATATAAPPLDPPAPSAVSYGLRAGGATSGLGVARAARTPGVFVLPRLTPPARRARATSSSDSSGMNARQQPGAELGGHPRALDEVLVGERQSPQRRAWAAPPLQHPARLDRRVGGHRDEGAEPAVEPLDALKIVVHQFERRDLAASQPVQLLLGGQVVEFDHAPSLGPFEWIPAGKPEARHPGRRGAGRTDAQTFSGFGVLQSA